MSFISGALLLFSTSGVSRASVWTMVLQGLTEGGVSGLITGVVLLLVGEECNTERGRVPTHRKCLSSMNTVLFSFSFSISLPCLDLTLKANY